MTEEAPDRRTRLLDRQLIILAVLSFVLYFCLPFRTLASEILIFALGAVAFNLLLGYTGLLSFGQAAFFGAGSYLTGLLLIHLQWNPLWVLLFASCLGAALAAIIGFLCIQQVGLYFVMLTLAFNQLAYFIVYQWKSLTGGDDGLLNVPRPDVALLPGIALPVQTNFQFFIFVWLLFIVSVAFLRRVIDSPFGRILVAVRENPERARAVGYNIVHYKLLAFIISGFFTGLAGGLYTLFMKMVPITSVELSVSSDMIIMALVGGTGSLYGPILGTAVVKIAAEALSLIWSRWLILLGLIFMAFVLFMRGGLWGLLLTLRAKRLTAQAGGQGKQP